MKVLTLTTQFANNYGALLQCYALSKYLNQIEGVNCEVIDYHPTEWKRSWQIVRKPHSFKDFAKIVYSMFQIKYIQDKQFKNRLMREFIKNYLPLSSTIYERKTITLYPPIADAYICGSDQIWNQVIFKDMTYFLDFVKTGKRISYAASIADPWNKDFEKLIKPELGKFDAISVREKGNIPQVQNLVKNKHIQWVVDPVFLLEKQEWDKIAIKPQINEPYIFCYFLNVSPFAVEIVNKLRKMTGLKVVVLGVDNLDKLHSDILIRRAGPCDFVGLIKSATFICTNSFHCSAFSTIYEKRFVFVPKTWANERLISLEEIFGINVILTKDRAKELSVDMWNVDYSKGKIKGEEFIKSSKEFLKNALYG